jgi:SAM-dependent methyltransferase
MRELSSFENITILDLLSGHGFLSAEIALRFPHAKIIGIGLGNDVDSWKKVRNSKRYDLELWNRFHYLLANVTYTPIKTSSCDMIVNFLGLEDLHMSSGVEGIEQMIREIGRITRDEAIVQISLVEYGDSPEETVAKEVWERIGLSAVFLEKQEYLQMFEVIDLHLVEDFRMDLGMKMSASQAEEELKFACHEAPKIFSNFGVVAVTFDELWEEFGERIETHGFASWSQVHVMVLSKS